MRVPRAFDPDGRPPVLVAPYLLYGERDIARDEVWAVVGYPDPRAICIALRDPVEFDVVCLDGGDLFPHLGQARRGRTPGELRIQGACVGLAAQGVVYVGVPAPEFFAGLHQVCRLRRLRQLAEHRAVHGLDAGETHVGVGELRVVLACRPREIEARVRALQLDGGLEGGSLGLGRLDAVDVLRVVLGEHDQLRVGAAEGAIARLP